MQFTLKGGEVLFCPSFGVNGFVKNFFHQIPKRLSGIFGTFEDSIVSLFPSALEHVPWSRHPKFIEDISFKRRIHPLLERIGSITFGPIKSY